MADLLSLRRGAKELGIALSTLQHHVKRGNVRLFDGKVDVDVARIQLARNADPEQSVRGRQNGGMAGEAGGDGADGDRGGLWDAKERSERLRAELLEIELAEKRGELVKAEDIRRAVTSVARISRDALLSLPTRVSAELAAETDAGKVHDRLVVEIRKICSEIAAGTSGVAQ